MGTKQYFNICMCCTRLRLGHLLFLYVKIFKTLSCSLLLIGSHPAVQHRTRTYSCLQFGTHWSFTFYLHSIHNFYKTDYFRVPQGDNAYFIEHDHVCFYSHCWNGRISSISYGGMVFMCTYIHTHVQMSTTHSLSAPQLDICTAVSWPLWTVIQWMYECDDTLANRKALRFPNTYS